MQIATADVADREPGHLLSVLAAAMADICAPSGRGRKRIVCLTDERYEERTLKNGFRPARAVLLYAAERKPIPQSATKSGIKRMPASTPGARGGLAPGLRSKP